MAQTVGKLQKLRSGIRNKSHAPSDLLPSTRF